RNKERLCALRPLGGTLMLDTLLYPDEIRVDMDSALPKARVTEAEMKMAHQLIDLMAKPFDPEEYKDHYREALMKVIEAKLEGEDQATEESKLNAAGIQEKARFQNHAGAGTSEGSGSSRGAELCYSKT